MDNYNNMMNQQYGNIVYSNNMMQPNMPMQQNPSLIPENTQHNIQNDSRMPPSLMEPRGLQMVSENTNLTSDSMRIADNNMDPVQNSYAQSSGNSDYSTNYVASMSTNANEMHNLNIPQPKLHENAMTEDHTQHLMQDDKYKQDTVTELEPIMTQQQYEPVVPPETNPPVVEEPPAQPVNEVSEEFKLNSEEEVKTEIPTSEVVEDKIESETAEIKESEEAVSTEVTEEIKEESVSSQIEEEKIVNKEVPEVIEIKEPLEIKAPDDPTELPIGEPEIKDEKEEDLEKEMITEPLPEVKPVEEDLSVMCRVCLKTDLTNLIDLCDQDGVLKLLEKVMLCASVQITKNDGLPCHICETCVEKLNVAYDFKITCESSDVELRKRLNIVVPKTVVKTEFVLIECDDQDYNMDESECEKPRSRRKYKEESDDYHVSDSVDDSGSDSSFSLSKSKSKRKSKRRTRSTSKRQLPKRERRSKEWQHEVISTPEVSRKRTKYVVDPDDDKPLITIKKIKSDEKTPKHACEICNKTFPYLSFLKQHMLTHQGKDTIIKCKFCTAKFTVQEDYKQHTLDYHAEDLDDDYPIVTPKKYKKALSKTDSGDEERTPRERKNHKCPYCDVICTSAMKLKTHKRTHVGEKPFVCHICQKPFKQTVSLEAHIKRHAEDKSLQCEHCQKIFPAKSELNRHIKTEHVEKHFECAVCNKEFPTKVKLDKHVLKHEKEDEELSVKDNKEKKTPSTKDLFKSIAPITSTYWSDSYSD